MAIVQGREAIGIPSLDRPSNLQGRPVVVLTEPGDPHADVIVRQLERREVPVFRVHTADFPSSVALTLEIVDGAAKGYLTTPLREVQLTEIRSVWYRRPGVPRPAASVAKGAETFTIRQATQALRALYALVDAFWVSRPDSIYRAAIKPLQLLWAHRFGLATPVTLVTNDPHQLELFRSAHRGERLAVKPLRADGVRTGDGFRFPLTALLPEQYSAESVAMAPTIIQTYVEKKAELRCVVVGDQLFTVRIDSQAHPRTALDWKGGYGFDADGSFYDLNRYDIFQLPRKVETSIRRLMAFFDIEYASIDLIVTPEDEIVFLELNPNGQWLWLEEAVGLPIASALADLLAAGRV